MKMSSALKLSAARTAALGLAASAVLVTGCANMATTATNVTSVSGAMTGHVFGGNQPVSNADVRLYSAGATGYGSQGTLYATTTTDVNGNFSFTQTAGVGSSQSGTKVFSCPTTGNPQMYLIARGGNTQGSGSGNNSAAAFILALGPCANVANSVVDLTETTTVATLAALQQYFSPASSTVSGLNQLGYPASTQGTLGFANAYTMIGNLVNARTGTVAATTVSATPAGSTTAATVTVTPEISKINTLANIIAACVNTTTNTSGACTTLFQNATPPNNAITSQPASNYVTATDTLSALYFMLTNPTSGSASNINNLYALQSGAGAPFQPAETVAPTDWTVGLNYASTSTCSNGGSNFLQYVYHVAIDANGNAWAVADAGTGNLFEIATNGTPLACVLGSTVGLSNTVAIGPKNNVWVGGVANNNIYELPAATPTATPTVWPTGQTNFIQNLALDGNGNLDFTPYNNGLNMYQFTGASNSAAPTAAVTISSSLGTRPYYVAVDTQGRAYATDSLTTSSAFYQVYPSTAAGNVGGYVTANLGSTANTNYTVGAAAGTAGTIIALNGSTSSSTVSTNSTTAFTSTTSGTATAATTAPQVGGITSGRELAVDGAGNMWTSSLTKSAGSYTNGSTTSTLYMINELTATGVAISPSGTGTAFNTVNGGFQKDANVLPIAARGAAIDPSGNVWTASSATTGTSITLLVGAAVPVITPIASSLAAGAASGNAGQKP